MTIKEHRNNDDIKAIKVTLIDGSELVVKKEFKVENITFDINRDLDIIDIVDSYEVPKNKLVDIKSNDHHVICLENIERMDIFYN